MADEDDLLTRIYGNRPYHDPSLDVGDRSTAFPTLPPMPDNRPSLRPHERPGSATLPAEKGAAEALYGMARTPYDVGSTAGEGLLNACYGKPGAAGLNAAELAVLLGGVGKGRAPLAGVRAASPEYLSASDFIAAARRGVIGPAEQPGFTRIPRDRVETREGQLGHIDNGLNLGYKTDDIAAYQAHNWGMRNDPAYKQDVLEAHSDRALRGWGPDWNTKLTPELIEKINADTAHHPPGSINGTRMKEKLEQFDFTAPPKPAPVLSDAAIQAAHGEIADGSPGLPRIPNPILVRHASPYSYEGAPDASKIMSGQGANTFGHGFYAAENPKVMDHYYDEFKSHPHVLETGSGPHRYDWALHATEDQFLHWDKKLSDQSPFVQAALGRAGFGPEFFTHKVPFPRSLLYSEPRGGSLYESLARGPLGDRGLELGSDHASNILSGAGLPGLMYKDEKSRFRRSGTNNYVVFPKSSNIIEVLKQYGIAAPVGAGVLEQAYGNRGDQ